MRRKILPLLLALATTACGPLITEPKPDIPATVEYDTVRLEYGDGSSMALATALIGDPSWTAILSKAVVGTTNLIMLAPFILLNEIKKQPPTASGDGIWIWEFEDENGAFRMEIFDQGPSSLSGSNLFTFRILGGSSTAELLVVIEGEYVLAEGRFLGAQRGFGVLHFDFDNMRAIDKKEDDIVGQLYIAFRSLGGVRQVTVLADGVQNPTEDDEGFATSLYRYIQFRGGNAQLEFAAKTNFLDDGEPFETMAVHSAWNGEGLGRSISRISEGSLTINELLLEDCFDAQNKIVFADITPDFPELPYEDGESDACEPDLLELDLTPPQIQTPSRLTDAPGPHPDEQADIILDL